MFLIQEVLLVNPEVLWGWGEATVLQMVMKSLSKWSLSGEP